MKSDILTIYPHHLRSGPFILSPTIIACTFVIIIISIIIIIFLAKSVNLYKKTLTHKQGVKRKFETMQDQTPPRGDVNLVCSNTLYRHVIPGVIPGSFITIMIPSLFIYDALHPEGETLRDLCRIGEMGFRYPLGVRHYGYIKLYDQVRDRSQGGHYIFEGGDCTLEPAKLFELMRNGSVYSGGVDLAPSLPLYPILIPRSRLEDRSRAGVYLRS